MKTNYGSVVWRGKVSGREQRTIGKNGGHQSIFDLWKEVHTVPQIASPGMKRKEKKAARLDRREEAKQKARKFYGLGPTSTLNPAMLCLRG